ncbi:lumican [Lepisosteus oculatus]|uniref:lumican n=1 Tax=Lepisosteus oculatus TaxID=7918 RepID=UPI0037225CCC
MGLPTFLLCLSVVGIRQCLGGYSDYDYGGIPVMINRLLGEPSVLSLRGRLDASWYRAVNAETCPLECDCPVHWPSAAYCDHRGLKAVPPALPPRTQYLFLQGNLISSLPAGVFANATLARWLLLDRNQLASDQVNSTALAQLPHLENLFLNYNHLTDVPSPLPGGLLQLRLAHNRISKITPGAFRNLRNLTLLLLQGNQLQTIGEAAFKGLQSVILLDLSHNQLKEFPEGLPPSIQQLYISNNSLSVLQERSLMGFGNLQYLRISHNRLQDKGIASNVFNMSSIIELDLSYNQLTSVPVVSETLQYLYLQANLIQEVNMTSFCRTVGPVDYSHLRVLRLDGNPLSYHQLPSDWVLCLRVLSNIFI